MKLGHTATLRIPFGASGSAPARAGTVMSLTGHTQVAVLMKYYAQAVPEKQWEALKEALRGDRGVTLGRGSRCLVTNRVRGLITASAVRTPRWASSRS